MTRDKLKLFTALLAAPLFAQDPAQKEPAKEPAGCNVTTVPGVRKLSLGGQYRLRYEGLFNYDLDNDAGADNDYFTQRVRVNLGVEINDMFSTFFQVQDAREWGEEASTVDDAADGFDLHQGYLDVRDNPWFGGNTRVGRQEINLGDQRLIGALDWKSSARAFDGILQSWKFEPGTLLAFAIQAREVLDNSNNDARVFGGYFAGKLGDKTTDDFYLILLQDDGTTPGATQQRFTLGTRWITKPTDPLELGLEVATQFGDVAGADIPIGDTYAFHVHGTWAFDGAWKPRLTVACDGASGNDPTTADNERFNNLFPTAHAHWGMMDLAQWENLFNPWVRVAISPCGDCTWSLTWHHLAAMESGDAFRGPNATLSAGNPSWSKTMGEEIDLMWNRVLHAGEGVTSGLQVGYGLFVPGSGAKDANAGHDDLAHFLYAQFDLRF